MGTYFDPAGLTVTDGEIAKATDVNQLVQETDGAFQQAEQDIAALGSSSQAWAETDPYTPVTIGKYSSKHWAKLSEDWAIGTPTDNDGVPTGDQSAKKEAEDSAASAAASLASETAAEGHKSTAETYKDEALGYRNTAQEWAENPEDDPVVSEPMPLYSALHHATKSADSAQAAADSLSAIGDAESNCAAFEALAEQHKDDAETARDFAYDWATASEGQVDDGVNPQDYSAYYYAQQASAYRQVVEDEGDTQVARVIAEGDAQYNYINSLDAVLKNDGETGAAALPSGTTVERPGTPSAGDLRFNTTLGDFEGYNGSTWVLPGTGASITGVPVGSIIPYIGGYFTDGNNGGFTDVLGNDAASINALLNVEGFYVCDGSAVNLPASPIWNAAGRYLPNLTDDRFLMGDTAGGLVGGENVQSDHQHYGPGHTHSGPSHTHSCNPPNTGTSSTSLSVNYLGSHNHLQQGARVETDKNLGDGGGVMDNDGTQYYTYNSGSGWSHSHSVDIGSFTSGSGGTGDTGVGGTASTTGRTGATENRPKFLSCHYIIRVL